MTWILVALCVLAAVVLLWPREPNRAAADPCGPVSTAPWESGPQVAGQVTLCLVNRERTSRGLPALRENRILDEASIEHSQDMVRLNYFEHTAPDGRTVADRLRALGYQRGVTASGGENIAYGIDAKATPKAIVQAWMNSPPHREDILRPSFMEIGVGVAIGAPEANEDDQKTSATYTTDFGGAFDPSLPNEPD